MSLQIKDGVPVSDDSYFRSSSPLISDQSVRRICQTVQLLGVLTLAGYVVWSHAEVVGVGLGIVLFLIVACIL